MHARWRNKSAAERSEVARKLRRAKGRKHALVTLRALGLPKFARICASYTRKLGRKLTPAEIAHIRIIHRDEIMATAYGEPWPKKPRVTPVGTWTYKGLDSPSKYVC